MKTMSMCSGSYIMSGLGSRLRMTAGMIMTLMLLMTQGTMRAQAAEQTGLYWQLTPPASEPKNMQEVMALLKQYPEVFYNPQISHDTLSFSFCQFLDHTFEADPKGKYYLWNRVYITKYISAGSPTVLHTSGYAINPGDASYFDLAKALNANMIQVECRYNGLSVPTEECFAKNGGILGNENYWPYNNAYQQATDLAYVVNTLKHLKVFSGQWIATGTSKCGMTTTFLAMYHPGTCDVYVPFCAPFCKTLQDKLGTFVTYDYAKKLAQYSADDAKTWNRSWMALRDYWNNAALRKVCNERLVKALKDREDMTGWTEEKISMRMVETFYDAQWEKVTNNHINQWKMLIPSRIGASDSFTELYSDSMFVYLTAGTDTINNRIAEANGNDEDQSRRFQGDDYRAGSRRAADAQEYPIDEKIYCASPYEVQSMYELGNTVSDYSNITDLLGEERLKAHARNNIVCMREPNHTIAGYLGVAMQADPIKPIYPIEPEVRKYVKMAQVPIFFVYGEFDPWTLAGISDEDIAGNPYVSRYVVPSGVHNDNILSDSYSSDPKAGPYIANKVKQLLKQATSVKAIRNLPAAADNAIYDLQGRRVTMPKKGLYIKGGKRFVAK